MKTFLFALAALFIGAVLTGAGAMILSNHDTSIVNEVKIESQAEILKEIRDDVKIIKERSNGN